MGKNLITQGIVLSIKPLGENNSSVFFFTKDYGLIYTTMYGGHKSRFKSLVSPWNYGMLYLSESSKFKTYKISDFDVKNYHLSFREDLTKSWSAALAAEILIKTKCAGNSEFCWSIFNGFIDGLELCTNQEQCSSGLIRFLWRFLELLGIQPDSTTCSQCGESFLTGKISIDTVSYLQKGAIYNVNENSFVCSDCSSEKSSFFLNIESIRYLAAVSTLTPKESRLIQISPDSKGQLKQFLFYLIENACGTRLSCLETGMGIL